MLGPSTSSVNRGGGRLQDRNGASWTWRRDARRRSEDRAETLERLPAEPVPDPRPAALGGHPAGLAEDLEVVAHRRLGDVTARGEVARTDLGVGRELANDREPGGVGERLEEGTSGSTSVVFVRGTNRPLRVS
jgi:hypothetical protein